MLSLFNFIVPQPENTVLYTGNYDPVLVSLSIVVAIFASYAALLVSQHVSNTAAATIRRAWIVVGGLCLGTGIWAMHFVGMLAFSLPCSASYDTPLTLLLTIPGILASTLAIQIISRRELSPSRLIIGGLLIGTGIGAMHYSGMAAMRLNGMIRYDIKLFLLSILVAITLATLALWIKFRLQLWQARWSMGVTLASAVVMGLAVSCMHYTAMAAAYFIRDGDTIPVTSGITPTSLAAIVLTTTSLIVVVTIVASYIGKSHLFSLRQPYKLIGLLIVGWVAIAWLSADYYYSRSALNLYQREYQLAALRAENIVSDINENMERLRGVALMVSRDEDSHWALRRFGANAAPSTLAYEARKQRWTRDKSLDELNDLLRIATTSLGADNMFVLNAAGDCIAAANVGEPGSFVGTNYADRGYFSQVRAGQPGHQYAVGRITNIPGLYYAHPVFETGRFLGAVVVKRNISHFANLINRDNAFIADANGVIVLAQEKRLEFRTLPNSTATKLSVEKRLLQYKRSEFEALEITSWDDRSYPSAVRIGEGNLPTALASISLPEDDIAVHVPRPLDGLEHLGTEKYWLFILLAVSGSTLIVAASAAVLYLRKSQMAETDLRIAATAFESQQGLLISDARNVILRVNQAFSEITGYSAEEAVGRTPHLLSSGRHDPAFYSAMWENIRRTGYWQGEIWNRRKSGEVYPEWLSITAVKDAVGNVTHYVGALTDITQRKSAEEEIKQLAFYDPLTQLPNRRRLMDRLQQFMALSARNGRKGALIFIDLDNFKDLNDTLGHDKGDQLLQQAAQRLATCVRDGDTIARLGGDEFVVMLEDLSEHHQEAANQARIVGDKVLAALNQPYIFGDGEYQSTSSVGITLFSGQQERVEEMLKQADMAMYQAKAAGRNTLRFFDKSMQEAVMARAAMDADLRQGLLKNQFLLYYQPQVDGDGHLTGAEALVRWQHPRCGMVSPAEFIPAAEDSGLILPLGHWVLETACTQLVLWAARAEMAHLTLAVNVSARQFRQPTFVDQVLVVLEGTGADPKKLKLELTESLLLDDVEDIIVKMTELKARGIAFSLDDFGTGYSSLAYLKRLPLDQLKIDQSFVRDVLVDPNDAAIARTIVVLGRALGFDVIAEGVENEAQRDFLASHGCLAYQGYLFGRPLPAEALELYLKAGGA